MLRILDKGEVAAEVPARSLADDAPEYDRESKRPSYLDEVKDYDLSSLPESEDYNKVLLEVLESPNIASKEWVYEQYDHMVRTNTVVLPGSDAAVLRVKGTEKGLAMTTDCNGRYCYLDPEVGGAIAVAEAARNIVCSGAEPIAITDGLNFGNPMKPEIYWQFEKCIEGISEACLSLDTPVTGGNVSFYNESPSGAIYPTPIIGMVGLLENIKQATTSDFKDEGDIILLLGETKDELGGSEYLKVTHNLETGKIPELDLDLEKRVQNTCLSAIKEGVVKSAHDCADGGLAVTLAESCISGGLGAEIEVDNNLSPNALLFSESQSRIVISVAKEDVARIEEEATKNDVSVAKVGIVKGDNLIINDLVNIQIGEMKKRWEESIRSKIEG